MAEYISPDGDSLPAFVRFCGHIAPFTSIIMFLSPIPTIRQILKNGTVGDLPLLPYTSMVASCFVWLIYGILKREPLIWGTNIIEFTLSLYYFVEFTNYAPKHSPTFPGSVYDHIKFCLGTWAVTIFVTIFFSNALNIIGDLTVLLEVLTFASPLAAIKAVIETQSSESIPWPFTLAASINCTLWFIEGVWGMHDYYVYFPSILGVFFAGAQIALKMHYGDSNDHSNPSYTRAPVEMPYPVLGSVRKVVMWGSNADSNNSHYYNNLPQDLQFDSNMPSSNANYVELGLPLTGGSNDTATQLHVPSPTPPTELATHRNHNKNNQGLDYSTVDGLQSIVFEDESIGQPPAPPVALRDSFRSRSGGSGQGCHSHEF